MNYYPFHIGDYVSATRHLSWEEDAAYRRLLDTYYTTEKPLPADLRQVCRLVLATTDSQRAAVEIVLGEFFQLTATGWISERAEREIAAMQDKQQKQRAKANKRWHKPEQEHGNASAIPRHQKSDATASENDADAMPPTPTPTPTPINTTAKAVGAKRRKPQLGLPDDFAPNEVGLAKAAEKHLDVQAELAKFRNHHEAKGSVMADWQAAWRTWVGNARPGVASVAAAGPKRDSDEYAALHRNAGWWRDAGFVSVWDAMGAKCWHDTAHQFRDGKRLEVAA